MGNGVDKEDDTVRGVGGGIDAETKLVRDDWEQIKVYLSLSPPTLRYCYFLIMRVHHKYWFYPMFCEKVYSKGENVKYGKYTNVGYRTSVWDV